MKTIKTIKISLFLFVLSCLVGCGQLNINNSSIGDRFTNSLALATTQSNLAEVAVPKIIKELELNLEQYTPQVKIVTPKAEQTFQQTDISIKLEVEDLPIFRDDQLELGNHLNLIIDNEPFQPIYNLSEPIIIKNLTPGTHTIRAFATRPWGESFKTEGAYAQTTFNVLTETNDNRPESELPLLTYNSPTGTIGAEPLLLDFYLTNAPLHAIAQNNPNLLDWRVKATVNGTSFMLKDWRSTYLTGLKPGENWIQLELIDEAGNNIENAFNNTVRVFNYNPQQQDTLAKLVTNKVSLADAQSIVEQKYYIQPVGVPEIIDFEDSTKSENENIVEQIVEQGENNEENIVTFRTDPEISTNHQEKELTVPKTSAPEINQILDANKIAKSQQNQVTLPTTLDNIELQQKTEQIDIPEADVDTSRDQGKLNNVEMLDSASLKIPGNISSINEVDADQEVGSTAAVSEPESLALSPSETKDETPPTQLDKDLLKPKTVNSESMWWKKILVGLRQKIEALARQLPDQV